MLPDAPPAPPFDHEPLPYEARLEARPRSAIEGVVIHCTETADLAEARRFGETERYASGTGNSGHFYIDVDGRVIQYVALERIAHHVRGHNAGTVGIELVNRGRYPHWYRSDHQAMDEPYSEAQIVALLGLLGWLRAELPGLRWIAGHEDLDTERMPADDDPTVLIARKTDPGPRFPWPRIEAASGLTRRPAMAER
jgi:N-acetylmuramoyl-L-alanine amidase